jgi:hypothetical protein
LPHELAAGLEARDPFWVTRFSSVPRVPQLKGAPGCNQTGDLGIQRGKKAMRGGERADEKGEKSRRGQEPPPDQDAETEALSWAVRWVNNSNLRKSLQESSVEHLFRC